MNEKRFPLISINYASDKDSKNLEKKHKKKEIELQKYEKFKPKPKENIYHRLKTLRRTENKVKNLLSNFLKNYEIENKKSIIESNISQNNNLEMNNRQKGNKSNLKKVKTFIFKNKKKTNENYNQSIIKKVNTSDSKNKRNFIKKIKTKENQNKHLIKKVNTSVVNNKKHKIRPSFFNVKLNHLKIQSSKKKVRFNLDENYSAKNNNLNKDLIKKSSRKDLKNNNEVNNDNNLRTIKNKLKVNDFIKKIENHIIKRNKTGEKFLKKNNENLAHNNYKNNNINNFDTLIKKTKSVSQEKSYLKIKNDNFLLNKAINKNSILANLLKPKKSSLKNNNKDNKDIFNESIHNSLISDLSNSSLNKISIDMKRKKDDLSKKQSNKNLIFPKKRKSSFRFNPKLTNLTNTKRNSRRFSAIGSKYSSIQKFLNPKTINNLKKTTIFNKNNEKLTKTIIAGKKVNLKKSTKLLILDMTFRSLKEKLRKTFILRPEELDSVSMIDKNKDRNKNTLMKLQKSNKNLVNSLPIVNREIDGLKDEQHNNLNKENFNNTNLEESKKFNKNKNLDKNTLQSEKSIIESSSYTYLIKRKFMYHEKYRILTHKAKVYDSLNDEELEDEEDIYILYLDPNSLFTVVFDFILFIVSVISLIEIPFYLAINKNFCRNKNITIHFSFNSFIDLLYIIDLFLGFFRAYYNWEEQLIKKKRKIVLKYLKGWFLFDLIASIPIYTINKIYEPECIENENISKYSNIVLNNLHYLLISNRLFKVFKVFLNNKAWKIISNKLNEHGKIILYISLIFAAINYTACIYIFIGRNSFPNWIFKTQLETQPFITIYICAIYVLTMAVTTVGYGDITCYSMNEIIFQLFILIIGIIGYSYVVSFVSNYIIKINGQSVDFEKKKEILDEIKNSYQNLPDELYNRILKYLKENYQKKKKTNIIFDCLPVGLKNNLITEMYKPIIQKFIFFKNFHNTDFIVKVILAFKPIIAYKNDILVNEDDMIEDIIFVKKGVLSLELPINRVNPRENIDKFLKDPKFMIDKGSNDENIENNSIIQGNQSSDKNNLSNSTIKEKDLNNKNLLKNNSFSMKFSPTFKTNFSQIEIERKQKEEKEKNFRFVRIIGIRENEHFGDVLMFLGQRSPFRVRVKSIKCELFFLKKIDAVQISTNYQNIWKRINKRSVYNYEQIKKSIKNIVEIYCAVEKIKSSDKKKKLSTKDKKENNNSSLRTIKEEENLHKNHSQKNIHIKYNKLFNNNDIYDDFILEKNNTRNKNLSAINLERKKNFILPNANIKLPLESSNSSLSSRIPSKKKSQKSTNTKIKSNNNNTKIETISNNEREKESDSLISEKTVQEDCINNSFNSKERKSNIPSIENKVYFSKNVKSELSNKNIKKNDEKEKRKSELEDSYNETINDELKSDEEINFTKEENLLNKKIDLEFISKKQLNFNKITHNNLISKNPKLEKFLNIIENKKDIDKNNKYINNNENIINENTDENNNSLINIEMKNEEDIKTKHIYSNKNLSIESNNNNDSNEICFSSPNNMKENILKSIRKKNSNYLTINNNISFKIESSYENFNLISGKILIKNKKLQNKIKTYLLNEIQKISKNENNNINKNKNIYSEGIKVNNTLGDSIFFRNKKNINLPNIDKRQFSPFEIRKNKSMNKKESYSHRLSKSSEKKSKTLSNSSSFNETIIQKNKININSNINKLKAGIELEVDNISPRNKGRKKRRLSQHEILNKNLKKFKTLNNQVDNSIISKKKNRYKPNSIKKKKDNSNNNLLSKINLNIQKTNQNLNNPEEFYSSYFNSLLGEKKTENIYKKTSAFFIKDSNIQKLSKRKSNAE